MSNSELLSEVILSSSWFAGLWEEPPGHNRNRCGVDGACQEDLKGHLNRKLKKAIIPNHFWGVRQMRPPFNRTPEFYRM